MAAEKKTDKPKRKPGRPTKYKDAETVGAVYAVVDRLRATPSEFLQVCGMEQLADALNVSRDTLYEWAKEHPEFSDALKSWLTARNACFYRLAKTLPPAIWIFMAKNWLGMRDKQTIELPGMEQTLRFQFGDAAPVAHAEPPKMTYHIVYTKDDPDGPVIHEQDLPGPLTTEQPGPLAVPQKSAEPKVAADLSDAELEAEITRLEREKGETA